MIDMTKCVDIKSAWDFNILCDWFINSIDETEPLMFNETEIVAEKRRMSSYMVKNAADMIYAENQ